MSRTAGFFDKLAIPAVDDDESIDIDNPSSPHRDIAFL
jgi:hypothetical protein